jgi:hypothetical protein
VQNFAAVQQSVARAERHRRAERVEVRRAAVKSAFVGEEHLSAARRPRQRRVSAKAARTENDSSEESRWFASSSRLPAPPI